MDIDALKREALKLTPTQRARLAHKLLESLPEQYRQEAIMRLSEAIDALKREAHANGLTDADIDAELEDWRNERQVNPSKNP